MSAGLYMHPWKAHLREVARVEANHRGIVNVHEVAAVQDAAIKRFEPLMRENPDLPLDQFREIVTASGRAPLPSHVVAARAAQVVDSQRMRIYAPRKASAAVLAAEKAANLARPVLNKLLNETGAGNSVPLAQRRLSARADQLEGALSTAGRKGRFA